MGQEASKGIPVPENVDANVAILEKMAQMDATAAPAQIVAFPSRVVLVGVGMQLHRAIKAQALYILVF